MPITIIDCETAALPLSEIIVRPEFTAPSNYKDPEKIAKVIAEAREKWQCSLALSATTARVLCVGVFKDNAVHILEHEDEAHLLEDFWALYCDHVSNNKRIVGFYIRSFDIPFLVRRSWVNGVYVPVGVIHGRYLCDTFLDLADHWAMGQRDEMISLDDISRLFGIGMKNGEGKDFAGLWANPATRQQAIDYLTNDLRLTKRIAEIMGVV